MKMASTCSGGRREEVTGQEVIPQVFLFLLEVYEHSRIVGLR